MERLITIYWRDIPSRVVGRRGRKSVVKQSLDPRFEKAIERAAKSHRLKVIENLAGHGLGRSLHEEPEAIVGFYDRRDRRRLEYGQVIAVEPFLSTRSTFVSETGDGWTLVGDPESRSAQFEHTVIVTDGAPIVATRSRVAAPA